MFFKLYFITLLMTSSEINFILEELCWAKLKGYPWWPAIIVEIQTTNEGKYYKVLYTCEKNYSLINEKNIKKWKDNYEELKIGENDGIKKKQNKSSFICALKIADLYYEGKINLDDHNNFLIKYPKAKERNQITLVEKYFEEIIKNKKEPPENIICNEIMNDNCSLNENKEGKKGESFIGKKRNNSKTEENKEEKDDKNNVAEKEDNNEENLTQEDLDKIQEIAKKISLNVDAILEKAKKDRDYFANKFKNKTKYNFKNNKYLTLKEDFLNYSKIIGEVLDVPISICNKIDEININIDK